MKTHMLPAPPSLDWSRVRAITLDLDDTLWPVNPTIMHAEDTLQRWLEQHAPATAKLSQEARQRIRSQLMADRPEISHDFSAQRLESLRRWLQVSGDSPTLATAAFEVFLEARQRVTLFADATEFLETLSAHLPVIALSNGNADVHRVGIGQYFKAAVAAARFGAAKPHPSIFLEAASLAEVSPEQVLHIGDDHVLDALPALELGMQSVWVNREHQAWPHLQHTPQMVTHDLGDISRAFLQFHNSPDRSRNL